MNPWILAAIVGGVYGISKMSSASTAAAKTAAKTSGAMTEVPKGFVLACAAYVLGGAHNPPNALSLVKAKFPSAATGDIVVPTVREGTLKPRLFQPGYAVIPKATFDKWVPLISKRQGSNFLALVHANGDNPASKIIRHLLVPTDMVTALQAAGSSSSGGKSVQQVISDAQKLISSAQSAQDVGSWVTSNAGLIASTIADVVSVVSSASSGDQATLNALKSQLVSLSTQAAAAGVKAGVDAVTNAMNSNTPTPIPTDNTPVPTDQPAGG